MSEPFERARRRCRQRYHTAAALVLTASGAGALAAGGLLGSPAEVVCSLCLLGTAVLVAWPQRHAVVVAIATGALLTVPTLTGYAFETIANKAIIAGKTKGPDEDKSRQQANSGYLAAPASQPATLSLLAMGASGLSIWRREESLASTQ